MLLTKREGFPGQLSYIIPEKIREISKQNPLIGDLYLTDIGFYPNASHHYRDRETGSEQYILIYNVEGFGTIKVNSTEHFIPPNHYFIIEPRRPHTYFADKQSPWSIYWIHFSGAKAKYLARETNKAIPVEKTNTSRINDRIALFDELFQNLDRGYQIDSLEYINLCLGHLLSSFTHLNQFRLITENNSGDPVSLSINYMLEHMEQRLTLSEIAGLVHLSPSYYSRLFVARTGFSPIDYFIHLKIQRSCQLLNNRDLSILDIARKIGIDDQFYFSRLFKKIMNMSPQGYRNSRVIPKSGPEQLEKRKG